MLTRIAVTLLLSGLISGQKMTIATIHRIVLFTDIAFLATQRTDE
jgi:hypothetical protein